VSNSFIRLVRCNVQNTVTIHSWLIQLPIDYIMMSGGHLVYILLIVYNSTEHNLEITWSYVWLSSES